MFRNPYVSPGLGMEQNPLMRMQQMVPLGLSIPQMQRQQMNLRPSPPPGFGSQGSQPPENGGIPGPLQIKGLFDNAGKVKDWFGPKTVGGPMGLTPAGVSYGADQTGINALGNMPLQSGVPGDLSALIGGPSRSFGGAAEGALSNPTDFFASLGNGSGGAVESALIGAAEGGAGGAAANTALATAAEVGGEAAIAPLLAELGITADAAATGLLAGETAGAAALGAEAGAASAAALGAGTGGIGFAALGIPLILDMLFG